MKICKAVDRNKIFFRKVFMPVTASRWGCRNYGVMFDWQPDLFARTGKPFRKYPSTTDGNIKRKMKKKWKYFFRNRPSVFHLPYMWWNGGEE